MVLSFEVGCFVGFEAGLSVCLLCGCLFGMFV